MSDEGSIGIFHKVNNMQNLLHICTLRYDDTTRSLKRLRDPLKSLSGVFLMWA